MNEILRVPEHYNTLVLSGGAVKGVLLLGALHYIYEKNYHKTITTFIGTSIGSIISYLLIIGYTPLELITYICTKHFLENIADFNINGLINGTGAMSFSKINESLERLTLEKTGKLFTLLSLFEKFNKKLVACTYNTTLDREEFLSSDTYPDMPCLTALKLSCALPLVFEECGYMGMNFIDGGIINNFPIECVKESDHGLCILTPFVKCNKGYKNILDHIYDLVFIPISKLIEDKLKHPPKNCDIIVIITEQIKFFNFHMSTKDLLNMYSDGYNCAKSKYIS